MLNDIYEDCRNRMEKAISVLKNDFKSFRTGRASASMLDSIKVDYYGTPSPINQIANISIPEPRLLVIKPWDAAMIDQISKAILASDIGITPQPDKNIIRLMVPQLTEETRKQIVKLAKNKTEDCKIAIRNVRRDANSMVQELEKDSEITEDDLRVAQKKIQDITDEMIKKVDELYTRKESEILEI
jgi:ribosome recycling factor